MPGNLSSGNDIVSYSNLRRNNIIAALITCFLIFFFTSHGTGSITSIITSGILAIFGGTITYSILTTRIISRFRLGIYVLMGILFTISFSIEHIVSRGSILLSQSVITAGTTPICPITIPFVSIPLVLTGKMIFPSTVAALISILLLWLAMIILLGRGWCSWICFFGWISQFFAALPKKPLIRLDTVPKWAKMLPYALMLFFILIALVTFSPVFCSWVCPLRIVYDPPMVTSSIEWIQALIFVIGGFVLLIAGPFLTKKRLYCSLVCPLLPANALVGIVSPFRVKVDHEKCINCGLCVKTCDVFAITTEKSEKPEPTIECVRCGHCMDKCPKGAIDYTLTGTTTQARTLFIILAVTFCIMMAYTFAMAIEVFLLTGGISS
ncbi:4Fe-4S binding protein [Methanospirillum lacunae]|uniref:4Fe-4S ferredoxin-type domain-containing protein n=1 Tax=Methanospirillum lacunae TaxID=668570 RepID=A0A2V2MUH5_9EURY|nr:4Fe-4S binding protein [Methanospirillum lacunae]PWR69825.1 hypothetical protein DK846_16750 [Methanospirillum lacunae]